MRIRRLVVCAGLAVVWGFAVGAEPDAGDVQFRRLVERWRWVEYWSNKPEYAFEYKVGVPVRALFAWQQRDPGSLGFCVREQRVCQLFRYGSPLGPPTMVRHPAGQTAEDAWRRLIDGEIAREERMRLPGERPRLAARRSWWDFRLRAMTVELPKLGPPQAIREKAAADRGEIGKLVASYGCEIDRRDCAVHLMIPYYSRDDAMVPVYADRGGAALPSIVWYWYVADAGVWWTGVMDHTEDRAEVERMRGLIQRALQVEVGADGRHRQ